MVTIKLLPEEARKGAAGDASALRRVKTELARAVREHDAKLQRHVDRRRALKLPGGTKERERGWPTLKLRKAVFERSGGRCENPDCGRRIKWHTFDLDHYVGKGAARAPQSPENTWALCSWKSHGETGCHEKKHAAAPSRVAWHGKFLLHLERRGFGSSETAKALRDELAAEEKLQEAQRHAALAVSSAGDLAERARRAKRADPLSCCGGVAGGFDHTEDCPERREKGATDGG